MKTVTLLKPREQNTKSTSGNRRKLQLTLVTEGTEETRQTLAVTGDVVAGPVTVDALGTGQAAAVTVETRRTRCRGHRQVVGNSLLFSL